MGPTQCPADEATVNSFIKQYYVSNPTASPGIQFFTFKTSCKVFTKMRFAEIKEWFRARPQLYTVLGQVVVPHGMVVELSAISAVAAAATPVPAVPEDSIPAAVMAALTQPDPAVRLSLYCSICRIRCTSEDNIREHLRGARHRKAVAAAGPHVLEKAILQFSKGAGHCSHCELCGKWFTHPNLSRNHAVSSSHRARVFWMLLRRSVMLMKGEPSGGGPASTGGTTGPRVTVSCLPHPLPPVAPGESARHTITLQNHGPGAIKLRSIGFLVPVADSSMCLEAVAEVLTVQQGAPIGNGSGREVWLYEGNRFEVVLVLAPRALGLMRNVIVFDLAAPVGPIARPVAGACCPPDMEAPPPPSVDAEEQQQQWRAPKGLPPINEDVVEGDPPPGYMNGLQMARPLQQVTVPEQLRELVARADWTKLRQLVPPLEEVASLKQYAKRLQKLLWLEELQHEIDIRAYDMKGVTLSKGGRAASLELLVPGLAENRPSVLKGDRLLVTPSDGSARGREWSGYVHEIRKETVVLRFADSFQSGVWLAGRAFNVRFTVNRSAFNLMQNALLRASDPANLSPYLVLPGSKAAPLPAHLLRHETPVTKINTPGKHGAAAVVVGKWERADLNDEQRLAVREILRGAHAPLPYIIFGPPGTGKTTTLVEAAKQLLHTQSGPSSSSSSSPAAAAAAAAASPAASPTRLLLVAPSNSAADLLIQSLASTSAAAAPRTMSRRLGPGGCLMMRLCAFSRPLEDLPQDLREQAEEHGLKPFKGTPGHVAAVNWDSELRAFLMPPLTMLTDARLRVVVATCATAARLFHAGIPSGHFSHILVDEAGHAEEPLLMCCLAGLAGVGSGTRVILAGDPRQLGPIIMSLFAKKYGHLDVSLLERLLDTPGGPYARRTGAAGGLLQPVPQQQQQRQQQPDSAPQGPPTSGVYPSTTITKLLLNYRSHPAILKVPNAAFYNDELRCAAPLELVNSMLLWEELPNDRVPVMMHHLVGKDEQTANSPSWYNTLEVRQVVDYVRLLLAKRRGGRVTANEIGIISPYKKQVQSIRAQLKELKDHIKVGSVEEFQGQERRIIIISTVRSSDEYLEFDTRHRLGFLANPKRFNVAITRAKALVVVVGNAQILVQDRHWRALLRFLRTAKAIVGQSLPARVSELLDAQEPNDGKEEEEEEGPRGDGDGEGVSQMDALADLLQHLVLGHEVRPPGEAEHAAMMAGGTVVAVEGGEMRRFD